MRHKPSDRRPPHALVAYEYFDVRPDMTDEELIEQWRTHPNPPALNGATGGIVELGQGGPGGLLISSEVLRAMPLPWFEFGRAVGWGAGEDGWFICKARRLGFKMYVDLAVKMSHLNRCAVWPKITAKGVTPQFQMTQAPRVTPYAFEAAPARSKRCRGRPADRERSGVAELLVRGGGAL